MSEWIECGLPWRYTGEYKLPYYKYPNLDKKIKKKFGKTVKEKMIEVYGTDDILDHPIVLAKEKLIDRIEKKLKKLNLSDDEFDIELDKKMRASKDPSIKAYFEYRDFYKMVNEWENNLPQVKEVERKNMQAYENKDKFYKDKSFCNKGLNNPGTLIEVKDGEVIKQLLIGDINCLAGVCDDCREFNNEAIVLRYKVLFVLNDKADNSKE